MARVASQRRNGACRPAGGGSNFTHFPKFKRFGEPGHFCAGKPQYPPPALYPPHEPKGLQSPLLSKKWHANHVIQPLQGMNERKLIRDKAAERLEFYLDGCHQMCRVPDDPLRQPPALRGETLWPDKEFLKGLSRAIRHLASLYGRGKWSTWSCILAIQNKRPALKPRKRIEDMVDRALKLRWKLPRAIEIAKQARKGGIKAEACLADLGKCFDGRAEIMSIEWDRHSAILAPSQAKGESCRDKAAQICLDWMRFCREIGAPASTLTLWLVDIGNLPLAKKLDCSGSDNFFIKMPEMSREDRRRERAALRQKKHRLKDKDIALAQDEIDTKPLRRFKWVEDEGLGEQAAYPRRE